MRERGHTPAAERVAAAYSRTGEHAACWLVLGAAGSLLAHEPTTRRGWASGFVATAFAYGLNYGVKLLVRRQRPPEIGEPLTPVVSRLSFPSAHATTSFCAAGVYRRVAPSAAPLLYGAAGLFALSRPYLGVHYPSDVLAGAGLGTLVSLAWPHVEATVCR